MQSRKHSLVLIQKEGKAMSAKENLALVRDMYAALNAQKLEAHDQYWREDMIWHGPPGFGDIHGLDGFKEEVLKPFYQTFPDYHVVNEIEIADENWVAATGILTGTHQAEWLGIAATGKPVTMRFSDFWQIKEGKLSENWVMVDQLAVLHQIGACPLPWKFEDEIQRSQETIKTFNTTAKSSRSAQQNLDLVNAMIEVLVSSEHDRQKQNQFWIDDMIWHGPAGFGDIHSLAGFQQDVLPVFYDAFPDFYGDFEIVFADGNWVAGTGYVTGTHQGDWLGIPATGKPIKMRYSDFWLIRDDKLAENWVMVDHLGVLEQIGVNPMTGQFQE